MKRIFVITSILSLFILNGCSFLLLSSGIIAGWYGASVWRDAKTPSQIKGDERKILSFKPYGRIDNNFDYENFRRKDNGYSFTLINKRQESLHDFHVLVNGLDVYEKIIYQKRFYVDSIEGKEKINAFLHGYNNYILDVKVSIFQNPKADVRSR